MKKEPYDKDKLYIITVKFVKRGKDVEEFVEKIKKRNDYTPPYWINEKRFGS